MAPNKIQVSDKSQLNGNGHGKDISVKGEKSLPKRMADIVDLVKVYTKEHGRGTPAYEMLSKGYRAREFNALVEMGFLEAGKGKSGGYWIKGEKPEIEPPVPSLKAQMADVLRDIVNGRKVNKQVAQSLINEYETEMKVRAEVMEKARAARGGKGEDENEEIGKH